MKHVHKGIKKVVKKYDIHLSDDRFLTKNFELADRVWDAAVEFLAECGVYSKDTGRVIQYSEKEIRELVRMAPKEITYGDGQDKVIGRARAIDDQIPPLNVGGPVGIPTPNEYFDAIVTSYLQEPRVDMFCPPTNIYFHGNEIRTRSPLEILAANEEISRFRNIAQIVGRPGLHYLGIVNSVSDIGQLSAGKWLNRGDGHAIGIISELKTDNSILNKVTYGVLSDIMLAPYANPIYGGLGGGLEGQIVLMVAEMIMCSAIFLGDNVGTTPTHPIHFISTTKELLQETNIAFTAISRNSNIMSNITVSQAGGLETKTLLYEIITSAVMVAKSGISDILGPRGATGVINGVCSGLDARFQGEVLHAACMIDQDQAEMVMEKAYDKCKDDILKKPYGKPFWEAYDVFTIKPREPWQRMYEEVKEEAIGWGLPLDQV